MNKTSRVKLRNLVFFCFERGIPIVKTGSRFIRSSQDIREDSDYDFVIQYDFTRVLKDYLVGEDFEETGTDYGDDRSFYTYRYDQLNIILSDKYMFRKWRTATYMANVLGTKSKEDRVALFDTVFKESEPNVA